MFGNALGNFVVGEMSPKAATPVATSGKTKDGAYYNLAPNGPILNPGMDTTPMAMPAWVTDDGSVAPASRWATYDPVDDLPPEQQFAAVRARQGQVATGDSREATLAAVVVEATAERTPLTIEITQKIEPPSLLDRAGTWFNEHYDRVSLATHTTLSAAGAIPVLGLIPDTLDLIYTAVEMPFGKSSKADLGWAVAGVLGTLAPVGGDQVIAGAKITARGLGAVTSSGADAARYERYWDKLGEVPASLSNREARAWYLSKEMEIPGLLDAGKSLEYQAKQAFEIRNDLRSTARSLMADQRAADYLRINEPNLTWDELVAIKSMKNSGGDVWSSIINSSQKSRASVNSEFNFVGDRPRYDYYK